MVSNNLKISVISAVLGVFFPMIVIAQETADSINESKALQEVVIEAPRVVKKSTGISIFRLLT